MLQNLFDLLINCLQRGRICLVVTFLSLQVFLTDISYAELTSPSFSYQQIEQSEGYTRPDTHHDIVQVSINNCGQLASYISLMSATNTDLRKMVVYDAPSNTIRVPLYHPSQKRWVCRVIPSSDIQNGQLKQYKGVHMVVGQHGVAALH